MNGRIGRDKALGRYTFRNTSVIDYTLCTADVFKYLTMFEVIDMDPLFSDGHCLLSTTLESANFSDMHSRNTPTSGSSSRAKWDERFSEVFNQNINIDDVEAISSILSSNRSSERSNK